MTHAAGTDPCACSQDGFAGGIDGQRPGCGQYRRPNVTDGYCMVVQPNECKADILIESQSIPGTMLKPCNLSSATSACPASTGESCERTWAVKQSGSWGWRGAGC